jgi:hypothetical protein
MEDDEKRGTGGGARRMYRENTRSHSALSRTSRWFHREMSRVCRLVIDVIYPLTTMRSGIAARGGTARSLRGVLPK